METDFSTALGTTPQLQLHRVLTPLCWETNRAAMRRADGEVKSVVIDGQRVPMLLAQPRRGRVAGVSRFVPLPSFSPAVHTYLRMGSEGASCAVTLPNTPLPHGLKLFNDIPELALALNGQDQPKVPCMSHWVLYTERDMLPSEFEAAYQLFTAACQPCIPEQPLQAAADIWDDFGLDDPADPFTCIAVEALDILSDEAHNPNHRLCARMFSLHLRSADSPFNYVLHHWSICNLVAAGLPAMVIADPWLWNDVLDVCKLLSIALDDEVPKPVYRPPWTQAHPFQFRTGQYTDKLYDEQIQRFAPGYADDAVLRSLVRTEAIKLFNKLKTSGQIAELDEAVFEYCGVPMRVICSFPSEPD